MSQSIGLQIIVIFLSLATAGFGHCKCMNMLKNASGHQHHGEM